MSEKKKVGRKHKFTKGGEMKICTFTRSLPIKGEKEIKEAINKTINQFKDYDWT
jgi:hypothetical protein